MRSDRTRMLEFHQYLCFANMLGLSYDGFKIWFSPIIDLTPVFPNSDSGYCPLLTPEHLL